MSADSMIRDASTKQTFSRGEDLVAAGAVLSWQARGDEGGRGPLRISGTVLDRGAELSDVCVVLDPVRGEVLEHSCPCDTRRAGNEMCKHAVAVALAYLDDRRGAGPAPDAGAAAKQAPDPHAGAAATLQTAPTDDLICRLEAQTQRMLARYRSQEASAPCATHAAAIQEPRTSPQVMQLVCSYAEQRARSLSPSAATGDGQGAQPLGIVDLFPTLVSHGTPSTRRAEAGSATWTVRLRIGNEHASYMVRQIDELIRTWETQGRATYGRLLSFTHRTDAFSPRAQRILTLLARVLHAQEALRDAGREAPRESRTTGIRALPLSDADAADLLDAMMGGTVQFEPRSASGAAKPVELTVCKGDPLLDVTVAHARRGGFDLQVPAGCDCVFTTDRLYLLHDRAAWRCSDAYRARMGTFCRAVFPAVGTLHVRENDMPAFCSAVLPAIEAAATVAVPEDFEALLPPPAQFAFRLATVRGCVVCDATVSYAGRVLGLFEEHRPGQPLRDHVREHEAVETLRALFDRCLPARPPHRATGGAPDDPSVPWHAGEAPYGRPCFSADNTQRLYRLIAEGIDLLRALGDVYVAQDLEAISVRPAPRVRVEASIKSGLLDISVDSDDLTANDMLAYLASFERKQRYVRLEDGDLVSLDESGIQAICELAAGLGVSARSLLDGSEEIPANRAPFVDALMKRAEGVRFDRDESFRRIIRDFDSIGDNDFVEPPSLRGVLRPYQRQGFKWICTLARLGFGGILADEMGLGKTLQVISYLLACHEAGEDLPSLVVCPASLVYNWTSELARFSPGLSVAAVTGTPGERAHTIATARGHDVLVTSYELLKRDVALYDHARFHCQVLDEAQYIKNHTTQAARCAKAVHARIKLALTGTPVENRLSELWSIFDYLMPGMLGEYEDFRSRFETPIVEGDERAAERLRCMVGPFVLRRLKANVLKDLPAKSESIVYADMSGEQDRLYRAAANNLALALAHQLPAEFSKSRIAVLAELTRLRQICCDPHLLYDNYEGGSAKLETCLELVANAVDGGHKVLLFSQFTSMLAIIGRRLAERGIPYWELTGSTPKEERARLVASFAHDGVPVFLISLKAGGVGLNLTAADIVIHYDPWWNLAAQNQATDRAHRIGQTSTVTVLRLIAKGTIEEKIVALQEAKKDLAETILNAEAAQSHTLTREDILALLEG